VPLRTHFGEWTSLFLWIVRAWDPNRISEHIGNSFCKTPRRLEVRGKLGVGRTMRFRMKLPLRLDPTANTHMIPRTLCYSLASQSSRIMRIVRIRAVPNKSSRSNVTHTDYPLDCPTRHKRKLEEHVARVGFLPRISTMSVERACITFVNRGSIIGGQKRFPTGRSPVEAAGAVLNRAS
jgi:hypothetical protein